MSLNQVDLLNRAMDARDEARQFARQRKEKLGG